MQMPQLVFPTTNSIWGRGGRWEASYSKSSSNPENTATSNFNCRREGHNKRGHNDQVLQPASQMQLLSTAPPQLNSLMSDKKSPTKQPNSPQMMLYSPDRPRVLLCLSSNSHVFQKKSQSCIGFTSARFISTLQSTEKINARCWWGKAEGATTSQSCINVSSRSSPYAEAEQHRRTFTLWQSRLHKQWKLNAINSDF